MDDEMKYFSTRGGDERLTFEEVSLGVVSAEDATVLTVIIFRLVTYLLGCTYWSSS